MIKCRKKLLEEADIELEGIRDSVKTKSFTPVIWYEKYNFPLEIIDMIQKEKILEKEVLSRYKLWDRVDRNRFWNRSQTTGARVSYHSKLLKKLLSTAKDKGIDPKNKPFLYKIYFQLLDSMSIKSIVSTYGLDPLEIIEYLLKNNKLPKQLSNRSQLVNRVASWYYNRKNYETLSTDWSGRERRRGSFFNW